MMEVIDLKKKDVLKQLEKELFDDADYNCLSGDRHWVVIKV